MSAWVVEWHWKGGLHCLPLEDVLERNRVKMRRGEISGYIPVGLYESYEDAEEGKREAKRQIRKARAGADPIGQPLPAAQPVLSHQAQQPDPSRLPAG